MDTGYLSSVFDHLRADFGVLPPGPPPPAPRVIRFWSDLKSKNDELA